MFGEASETAKLNAAIKPRRPLSDVMRDIQAVRASVPETPNPRLRLVGGTDVEERLLELMAEHRRWLEENGFG